MNNIRFISSFTTGTIYEKIANEYIRASFEHWNLPYHIFAKPDLGKWDINSRQRPLYIKEAMELFDGENIVWIDADARILKYPNLFFKIPDSCHVGVNYLEHKLHYYKPESTIIEILDGTSYYKNCPEMITFCDEWIERSVHVNKNHRHVLNEMINEKIKEYLNLFIIPRDYCYILNTPDGRGPAVPIENPVVVHYQASRDARHDLYDTK